MKCGSVRISWLWNMRIFFFFFCWSAVGFCDLQPISVQYILYVFVSETAQCLQEMHSFAVGHMGSFAFLWWRWEDKVCCLLFFSFLNLLLCFVSAYSWGILKDAWDKAEFSPLTSTCKGLLDFFFQNLEGLLFKFWRLRKKEINQKQKYYPNTNRSKVEDWSSFQPYQNEDKGNIKKTPIVFYPSACRHSSYVSMQGS